MHNAALIASGIVTRFGKRLVIDGAELVLRPGEVVAIVGENGAGKTTLLRICGGYLAADAGTVQQRGRIGYCPQQPALFDLLTAREHSSRAMAAVLLSRTHPQPAPALATTEA
jgi:ABC-2 type transport system ATP-binding protein